jgi:hypothetical protein
MMNVNSGAMGRFIMDDARWDEKRAKSALESRRREPRTTSIPIQTGTEPLHVPPGTPTRMSCGSCAYSVEVLRRSTRSIMPLADVWFVESGLDWTQRWRLSFEQTEVFDARKLQEKGV